MRGAQLQIVAREPNVLARMSRDGVYKHLGGPSAVIVTVDLVTRGAEVVWFAAMVYGSRCTTNNVTEYWDLVHGLQYVVSAKYRSLHVVGDSSLILNQVRRNRRLKATHLVSLHQARHG